MGGQRRRTFGVLLALGLQVSVGLAADIRATAEPPVHYERRCGEALTVWRKVRDPRARECCALALRARAGLWSAPERARELSARAANLCPDGLEAAVSVGAALLASGESVAAHQTFERMSSGKDGPWVQLSPAERLLAARAANLAGATERALAHYRSVILDLEHLASPHERARVLLEAAMVAAHTAPTGRAEALAYVRQSVDHPSPRLTVVRLLVLHALRPLGEDSSPAGDLAEARELVLWMQGQALAPRGAPGELLPVLAPDLMAKLLPAEPSPEIDPEWDLPLGEGPEDP